MNDRKKSKTLDETQFDLLVDGELSAAEYQAVLAQLDAQPDLWRSCALAFLEAQAWRSEVSAIRRGQEVAGAPKPAAVPAGRAWRRWLPILAIAASFVLAFAGGLMVQRQFDRARHSPAIAREPDDSRPGTLADGAAATKLSPLQAKDRTALGNIRLVVDGGEGNQPQNIDVPVYDGSQMGTDWLTQSPPVLTDDVIESLKRRGRRVERQIEYLPLPLDDQHQIVVPVEQIQITPVSRRSY